MQIVELEEIPLAYLTSPAVRIRVKAAGTLGGRRSSTHADLARQSAWPTGPIRPPASDGPDDHADGQSPTRTTEAS